MIKIQKNIPIPPVNPNGPRGYKLILPFAKMLKGDSFEVPSISGQALYNKAINWASVNGKNWFFKTRLNRETGLVRVWRIK